MVKFGLELGLKLISSAKTKSNYKLKTELSCRTEVNTNNSVLYRTCTMHLHRQFIKTLVLTSNLLLRPYVQDGKMFVFTVPLPFTAEGLCNR